MISGAIETLRGLDVLVNNAGDVRSAAPACPRTWSGAYLFLARDAMSGWITGATIDVNGGAFFR